ncbi:MAG: sigma-70 family RNA polymerase sigma factor [Pontiellaceae bacterium]|nr:sigma-70 family RNA polymerase sigma factor [Pontiellaceae bacterium]
MSDFTIMLNAASQGDDCSAAELLPVLYDELRRLAQVHMSKEFGGGHTLQATALVHEAWLRMAGDGDRNWQNRACFFSAASSAMRRIMVDHARKKSRLKRGGGQVRLDVNEIELADAAQDESILLIDEALEKLEEVNPQWARIVTLKFFGGMTNEEVAQTMGIGGSSVDRYWAGAKVWLYKQMKSLK